MLTTRAYSARKRPSKAGETAATTSRGFRAGSVMDDDASIHHLSTAGAPVVTAGLAEVAFEPAHRLHRRADAVRGLEEAVAFVGEENELDRDAAAADLVDHLLRL